MEGINRWLSFYVNESVNHDFAIRRYCPARMEQEQGGECQDQEALVFYDTELCSSDATSSTPCLASSEVDDFVDSFINMDQYGYENEGQGEKHQSFDLAKDDADADAYSMVNGVFGYVPTTMEDSELEIYEDLTTTILEEKVQMCGPFGTTIPEFYFATGLKCRLSSVLPHNVIANGAAMDVPLITRENKLEAFQLLYQNTPYIAFGFMAANEAICQASQGKCSIHIVDLAMEHTLQWSSLIRALASRTEGPPTLRITGLTSNEDSPKLQSSMNVLVEEATSLGMHLEFHMISEPASPSLLTMENLNLRKGEALFVNSILQLHKYVKESRGYLKEILLSIKRLGPTALTVVEQDTNHNGPFFLGRFLESLHYYSAIFDSLEASMLRNSQHRMKIERLHFAEEIRNIVAYEGPDRTERHERVDQWRRQLGRAGFQVMPLKCTSQARMMLSVYDCDGYTLSSEKGNLLLGWKGRPVMMASAWQVPSL
uniref:DELLA protein GAI1 n=1 Tax=Cajanus cajan TaxID=3821 RepID=A0A151QVY4_CAJCA|nr:DELLA protein GAI1 [Cajanus cajan]